MKAGGTRGLTRRRGQVSTQYPQNDPEPEYGRRKAPAAAATRKVPKSSEEPIEPRVR